MNHAHNAGKDAGRKFALIQKIVEDHRGLRSMDNNWPEPWSDEIQAVLDETYCLECSGYPGCTYVGDRSHMRNCSLFRDTTRPTPPEEGAS